MLVFCKPQLSYRTVGQQQPPAQVPDLSQWDEQRLAMYVVAQILTPEELSGAQVLSGRTLGDRLEGNESIRPYLEEFKKRIVAYGPRAIRYLKRYVATSVLNYLDLVQLLPGRAAGQVIASFNEIFARNLLYAYGLDQSGAAATEPAQIPEKLIRFLTVFSAFMSPLLLILLVIETRRKI